MAPHDRKALLKASYGLLTLWVINGLFGLMRASGPGAALPFIEVGLLLGYWVSVFYWWRMNQPKRSSSAAKRKSASRVQRVASDDVRKAVDLEEAVARERSRRRNARIRRTAGALGEQVESGFRRFQSVLIGGVVVITLAISGLLIVEVYKTQQAAQARESAAARTKLIEGIWETRNACLVGGVAQRWQTWYADNPETKTVVVNIFPKNAGDIKQISVTETLPTPASLSDVRTLDISTLNVNEGDPIELHVSQSHFAGFVIMVRYECELTYPLPPSQGGYDLDTDPKHWVDPFSALRDLP